MLIAFSLLRDVIKCRGVGVSSVCPACRRFPPQICDNCSCSAKVEQEYPLVLAHAVALFVIYTATQVRLCSLKSKFSHRLTHNSLNVMLEVIFILSYFCIPSYPSISVPESNVCLKYINSNDNIYMCYYTLLWHSCFQIQRKVWGRKSKFLIWLLFLGILLSVAFSMKTELSIWKQNKEF